MKKQVTLPLLTLLCLGLAAVPAMAQAIPIFNTDGPEFPSPVGTGLNNGLITSVSWFCPFADCDVTGASFWGFDTVDGSHFAPTQINWNLSTIPFNIKTTTSGTSTDITQIGTCLTGESGVQFCENFINFGRSVDMPHGTDFLALYSLVSSPANGHVIAWSNSDLPMQTSTAQTLNPLTGEINTLPTQLAFSVFGTPTVPEPSSMVLLGSGVLGLVGVLRRKLMR